MQKYIMTAEIKMPPFFREVALKINLPAQRASFNSDLDLAVLCTPQDGTQKLYRVEMKYFRELSRIIPQNLDIVILNRAGELLVYEVLSRGELIYQRDSAKRVEFEARRIADYLDFAPMMNRMPGGMMNKLKERVYSWLIKRPLQEKFPIFSQESID